MEAVNSPSLLTQPETALGGLPAYLEILDRYRGLDSSLVRLSVEEASIFTGLAVKTLESMRAQGRGPAFVKVGRRVEYRLRDVEDFVAASRFTSTRAAKSARTRGLT